MCVILNGYRDTNILICKFKSIVNGFKKYKLLTVTLTFRHRASCI